MPQGLDAIILAGGRGTRLRSVVSDVPKPLAQVAGRPFLDHQLDMLAASGAVRSVVLATGHLAEKVEAHYAAHPPPLPMRIAVETALLGTGGGVVNALDATDGPRVLVLNGDSLLRWSVPPLEAALDALAPGCGAALAVTAVEDLSRYGGVDVENGRVSAFREKTPGAGPGLINAGVYLFDRPVLESLPRGEVLSLEQRVFPELARAGRLAAAVFDSAFIDIGLPETYAAASAVVPGLAGRGPAA